MSASLIQPLPQEVVHLIAAGEVVDTVAAAVRELAENAVDAGATRITISIDLHRWQVRMADNGSGMTPMDLQQAATASSTSKIRRAIDLQAIHSLGFRGEALHSLAQLSALEISSYQAGAAQGWRCQYDSHGQPQRMEPTAIAPGTVVTVRDLFQRLPARRRALPPAQQLRHSQAAIFALALCHPQITWQVQQGERPWFKLYPGSRTERLAQILRLPAADFMAYGWPKANKASQDAPSHDVTSPCDALHDLVLALPDRRHRYRPDWVRLAINGRIVHCPSLEQAILGAFHRTLPRGRYPICAVHLQVDPALVDWNRHPAKTEVHLQQMADWREQVSAAIAAALRQGITATDSPMPRTAPLFEVAESGGEYNLAQDETRPPANGAAPVPQPLLPLTVLAQVHNTYILVEHPGGLWLIEQHIAHERVIYEQLCDRWQTVPLDQPLLLSGLREAQVERLQQIGVEIDAFGEEVWAVRRVPQPLKGRPDCAEALQELSRTDAEAAIVATACRTAIRNGTPLAPAQMQDLVAQWQQTRQPQTCPHGRPIYLSLAESQLSRFFRRHWVIGKSHGI